MLRRHILWIEHQQRLPLPKQHQRKPMPKRILQTRHPVRKKSPSTTLPPSSNPFQKPPLLPLHPHLPNIMLHPPPHPRPQTPPHLPHQLPNQQLRRGHLAIPPPTKQPQPRRLQRQPDRHQKPNRTRRRHRLRQSQLARRLPGRHERQLQPQRRRGPRAVRLVEIPDGFRVRVGAGVAAGGGTGSVVAGGGSSIVVADGGLYG